MSLATSTSFDAPQPELEATDVAATDLAATDLGVTVAEREPACARDVRPLADGQTLTIAEMAERLGLTAHTLRYYERIGLLSVPRDEAGHRVYGPDEVNRVLFVTRLRLTAMPIREIQAYFRLVEAGPGNEDQRLALLERHRDQVKQRLVDLESALGVIEFKIATYGGACAP